MLHEDWQYRLLDLGWKILSFNFMCIIGTLCVGLIFSFWYLVFSGIAALVY